MAHVAVDFAEVCVVAGMESGSMAIVTEQREPGAVLRTLDEQITPVHTALVIVDVQNDFVHPDGLNGQMCSRGETTHYYHGTGHLWEAYPLIPRALKNLERLLMEARQAGVFIVFVRAIYDLKYISSAQRVVMERTGSYARLCLSDSFGADFYGSIRPNHDSTREVVVTKHCWSGFWGTDLDMVLRTNGIKTVLMTGVVTGGCVESTSRDAFFNDYHVVAVEDCSADIAQDRHDRSMYAIKLGFGLVTTTEDVKKIWDHYTNGTARD